MSEVTITLGLSADSGQASFATLYLQINNSDGSAPTMALNPPNADVVGLVQPVANTGADPDFPPATYPWVGVVQANALGSCTLQLLSDGVVNQNIPVTVATPQTVFVTQQGIVVTAAT